MERFHESHEKKQFVPRGGLLRTVVFYMPSTSMILFFSFDQMYLKLLERGYFETLCAIMVFYFTLTAVLTRIMVKKIMVSNNGIFIQLLFSSVSLERRRLDRIYEDGSSYIFPCKKTFDFYLIVTLFFAGIGPAEDDFRIVGLFLHKQFFIEGDFYGIHVDTIDEVRG